ncbi:hypothetical protein Cni_G24140 [Canna indica]|uniref:Small auxin up regulated protein n=1 Tax=Canna indica TaxID=4628 RepID=A0AAQ3QL66_9LILI|nr:hypothetical protein Cni_G24140 [Canna indica]
MGWIRKKETTTESRMLDRLLSRRKEEWSEDKIPKGYVPMLVGEEEGKEERMLVHVKVLGDPRFAALMEMAAGEFGYKQEGIVRMPCNARHFQRVVDVISSDCKSR